MAYQISEKGKPWLATIKAAASQWDVPWALMAREIEKESGFDPAAYNESSGATGIAQFLPSTAAQLGFDPTDPNASIFGMAQYLSEIRDYLQTALGSWTWGEVLAGYNWGMGNVKKAVAAYGADWLSHAPAETQDYVSTIIADVGQYLA